MDIDALYCGDCLTWLQTIKPESVDLVYLDPPFFTQRVQKSKTRDTSQEYGFADTWASIEEYKAFMKQRIEECRRALKDTGSIFVHCDSAASHHLRLILDEVFGPVDVNSEDWSHSDDWSYWEQWGHAWASYYGDDEYRLDVFDTLDELKEHIPEELYEAIVSVHVIMQGRRFLTSI
jgi:DNA methylase